MREGTQIDVAQLERELARVELGHEQQVVDEPSKPIGVALGDREELTLFVSELSGFVPDQQVEVAVDRCQGSAQLVRDRRDELILQPIEVEEPIRRFAQRFLSLDQLDHPQQDEAEEDNRRGGDHDSVAPPRRPQQPGDRSNERSEREHHETRACECRRLRPAVGDRHGRVKRRRSPEQVEGDPAAVQKAARRVAGVQLQSAVRGVGGKQGRDRRDGEVVGPATVAAADREPDGHR